VLFVIGAQIHRYRAVSTYVQKQQSKWVFFGFLTMVGLFVVASGPWEYVRTLPAGTVMPWWVPLVESCWILAVMVMPLTLTISILRYRLYDVDVLINRTLMYGALSSVIVVFYVLVVGGMGVVFQSRGNLIFSLVATGIVAVLFDPLRTRLQSGVNRLLYGDREDPFSVLRKLGQRLEGAGIPEDLLDVIVETLGHTLKLPYAEIVLFGFEDPVLLSKSGKWEKDLQAFPIYHQGSQIGCLNVALRSPDEPFSESDLRLIRQIGRQAGSIAYAVQLTRELRQSRARIVNTREQERRRLYRDLHDGLGPVLASQGLKVAAVRHLLEEEPGMALEILDGLAEQNEAAVAEIRRLVYALRPPELDELGLVEAIREYAAGLNFASQDATQFRVSAPQFESRRPSLPIEVEVAAYRIATEAITNVTRHANAKSCTISLYEEKKSIGDELCLEIVDDGIGIEGSDSVGVGLHSMRERTREIGGKLIIHSDAVRGTKVEVRFPVTGFE
jgi:signal transduction histidine kinase